MSPSWRRCFGDACSAITAIAACGAVWAAWSANRSAERLVAATLYLELRDRYHAVEADVRKKSDEAALQRYWLETYDEWNVIHNVFGESREIENLYEKHYKTAWSEALASTPRRAALCALLTKDATPSYQPAFRRAMERLYGREICPPDLVSAEE